jgi:hypothetical protein
MPARSALDAHFPPGCGVRVIAEPGRYFAETSATLFATILGQRAAPEAPAARAAAAAAGGDGGGGGGGGGGAAVPGAGAASAAAAAAAAAPAGPVPERDYWLSDSTYGSFRILVAVDGLEPAYTVLRSPLLPPPGPGLDAPAHCRLWGDSTEDGDCVHRLGVLPRLRDGDWLAFPNAGAYTICSASNYGAGRAAEPTKLFVVSAAAARDLGPYSDPAAATAAAAAAPPAAPAAEAAPAGAGFDADAAAAADMLRALSMGCRCSLGGAGAPGAAAGAAAMACDAAAAAASDRASSASEATAEAMSSDGGASGRASPAVGSDAAMGGCDDEVSSGRPQA